MRPEHRATPGRGVAHAHSVWLSRSRISLNNKKNKWTKNPPFQAFADVFAIAQNQII